MDHFATRLDAWITRQDENDLDCPECETPLGAPIDTIEKVETYACTGKVETYEVTRTPDVAAIIGPGVDLVEYTECQSFGHDPKPHAPHEEVVTVAVTEQYGCECGWKGQFTTL